MKTIHTSILVGLLSSLFLPFSLSWGAVAVCLVLLVGVLLVTASFRFYIGNLLPTVAMMPGFILVAQSDFSESLRFGPILIAFSCFPFAKINPSLRVLNLTAFLCLLYIVFLQIGIAFGNGLATFIRDTYYPFGRSKNVFATGVISGIDFEYGSYRAGGIFHNPNVMGAFVFLLTIFFFQTIGSAQRIIIKLQIFTVITFAFLSLYLTGSRTYTFAMLVFFAMTFLFSDIKNIVGSKSIRARTIIGFFIGSITVLYLMRLVWSRLVQGFSDTGSLTVKSNIIQEYLEDLLRRDDLGIILLGGETNVMFDGEYGYWLGAVGLVGLMAIFSFYISNAIRYPGLRAQIVGLVLAGFGNSLFYALPTGVVTLIIFVVFRNNVANGRDVP